MIDRTMEKTLLWVDDDPQERYAYEIHCLNSAGWHVDWAGSGEEASEKLSSNRYRVLLLDQHLPYRLRDANKDVWGGCRLLSWLRRGEEPREAPNDADWKDLENRQALPKNREIPVLIFSAFYDEYVDRAIHEIDRDVPIEEKPVDEDRFVTEIERRLVGGGHD